jgi:GntR family transcriptional repressor for pyruvate dehydrogenase complex
MTLMAVTDDAISKIKDMILSGELSSGGRLPPEKELSERLGISRSSLREAVKALEVIHVLSVRRGDGTYVTSLEPRLLMDALTFVADLRGDDTLLDLFVVRRILEAAAASIAAGFLTEQELDALDRLLGEVGEDSTVEDLVEHDMRFHRAIAESSHNAHLVSLLDSLASKTVPARIWRGPTRADSGTRTLLHEHREIYQALRDRDASLASALMAAHIAGVEKRLRRAVEA